MPKLYILQKIKQHIATANDNFFKMEHIKFELHIKLFNATLASLVFENTQLHRNITISRPFLLNYTKMIIYTTLCVLLWKQSRL